MLGFVLEQQRGLDHDDREHLNTALESAELMHVIVNDVLGNANVHTRFCFVFFAPTRSRYWSSWLSVVCGMGEALFVLV